jgi:putative radical SAM enzyme (TIGR03279 family)
MVKVIWSRDKRIPHGSRLATINGRKIEDLLEFHFYNDTDKVRHIVLEYDSTRKKITFGQHQEISVTLETPRYRRCNNDCHFCFIKGLPGSLRKELYFNDDDYRLSFLFGNFLSLTNIKPADISRIARLKMSPLYVSVHTTNPELRAKLFRNERAAMIMDHLKALAGHGITLHCQIVVIPGMTGGRSLLKTIEELWQLYPAVASIGIVPVGRTKYVKVIPIVSKKQSRAIVKTINTLHDRFRKTTKRGFVYLADELFLKAGHPIPERDYYDDYPQYENGIGMIRSFLEEMKGIRRLRKSKGRHLILTGISAYPYLLKLKARLAPEISIQVKPVINRFLGRTVTVSGLLCATDMNQCISDQTGKFDRIILPPNCVNDKGQFLDSGTIADKRVFVSPKNLKDLIKCLH